VFLTVTGPFAMTTAGLLYYRFRPYGWAAVSHPEPFTDRPTPGVGVDPQTVLRSRRRSGNPAVRGRPR
jgi:hypothetical protein